MVVAVGAGAVVVSEFVVAVVTTVMVSVDSVLAPVETLTYFFFWTFLLFWDMVVYVSDGDDEIIDCLCVWFVLFEKIDCVVGVLRFEVQGRVEVRVVRKRMTEESKNSFSSSRTARGKLPTLSSSFLVHPYFFQALGYLLFV